MSAASERPALKRFLLILLIAGLAGGGYYGYRHHYKAPSQQARAQGVASAQNPGVPVEVGTVELAAVARRSSVLLAILDETGSPLQVLSLSVGMIGAKHPEAAVVREMNEALEGFAAARRKLSATPLLHANERLTLDAAHELERRG